MQLRTRKKVTPTRHGSRWLVRHTVAKAPLQLAI